MFNQPLIVAMPPWWRRSLRGWNPWGWRSMGLGEGLCRRTEGGYFVEYVNGFYAPGDGGDGWWHWDEDKAKKNANGGEIIDGEGGGRF